MALPTRKGYSGVPVQAVLTNNPGSNVSTDVTFIVNTVTNWPTAPFFCIVEPGTIREEKVKVTSRSDVTLTVVRAQDGTSASAHQATSSSIYPVFTAVEADEANQIASVMTTKGDVIATDGSNINRLGVGTNTHVLQADSTATNGIKWGQVATAGIADNAVTLGKLATALQAFLVPVGTISAYAGATAPTGYLLCDGTSTTGYTALAALVGATTPDMRGRFPIGDNSTLNLLGTGGSTTIAEGNLPSHTHTVSGTSDGMNQNSTPSHTVTDPGHNHTQNSHNHTQDAHNHTQNAHNHTQDAHNHTQDAHDHTTNSVQTFSTTAHLHDNADYFAAAVNGGSVTSGGNVSIFSATATNQATTATNQATTATNQVTTATNQANTATNIANTTGITVAAHNIAHTHTFSATTNGGTGTGTAYFQPYLVVNYIIKHD
jgi:microcystin-dependent protein